EQTAGADPGEEFLPVVHVAFLVGVDEGDVETGFGGQFAQRLQGRAVPLGDKLGDPVAIPVTSGPRITLYVGGHRLASDVHRHDTSTCVRPWCIPRCCTQILAFLAMADNARSRSRSNL